MRGVPNIRGGEEWIDRISRRDFGLVVTTFLIH